MNMNETGPAPQTVPSASVDANLQNPEFATHVLNASGRAKAKMIQAIFDDALNGLKAICTPGREFSLVKTHLETASFFAKKSMATNLNNQELY